MRKINALAAALRLLFGLFDDLKGRGVGRNRRRIRRCSRRRTLHGGKLAVREVHIKIRLRHRGLKGLAAVKGLLQLGRHGCAVALLVALIRKLALAFRLCFGGETALVMHFDRILEIDPNIARRDAEEEETEDQNHRACQDDTCRCGKCFVDQNADCTADDAAADKLQSVGKQRFKREKIGRIAARRRDQNNLHQRAAEHDTDRGENTL